jgi:hypothetical protein
MKSIKTVFREVYGLFVDDGTYAGALLLWLLLMWLSARRQPLHGWWSSPVLFAGLGGVLVENTLRTARRLHFKRKTDG